MKTQLRSAFCSVLLLALFACEKPKTDTAVLVETPAATPAEQKVLAPAPEVAVATPAPTTPPPDPIAPDGVFFLLTKASVVTDDGIVGLNPGSKLQRKDAGVYLTSAGQTVQLRDEQVTNNLRLAGLAAQSDAAAQASLRNERAKTEQEFAAREAANRAAQAAAAAAAAVPTPARVPARAPVAAPRAAAPSSNMASGGLGAVKSDKDNGYRDSAGFRHWTDIYGRWHTENPAAR